MRQKIVFLEVVWVDFISGYASFIALNLDKTALPASRQQNFILVKEA